MCTDHKVIFVENNEYLNNVLVRLGNWLFEKIGGNNCTFMSYIAFICLLMSIIIGIMYFANAPLHWIQLLYGLIFMVTWRIIFFFFMALANAAVK